MCNDNNDMTCIITTDIHAAINTLNSPIFTTEYISATYTLNKGWKDAPGPGGWVWVR